MRMIDRVGFGRVINSFGTYARRSTPPGTAITKRLRLISIYRRRRRRRGGGGGGGGGYSRGGAHKEFRDEYCGIPARIAAEDSEDSQAAQVPRRLSKTEQLALTVHRGMP